MNSDVLDFLEEIDNTVNVFAVRAALKEVSDSVSKLTKNVHLAASITTDTILSLINLSNILEYVDDYRNAKEIKDEYEQNKAFSGITQNAMDILGTIVGYVPGCSYTS